VAIGPTAIIATNITTANNQACLRMLSAILLLATSTEEILQNARAFILQQAKRDIAPVVEPWHLQKIHNAPRSPGHGICTTENNPADSCMNERSGAHRARFLRDIQIAVRQTPIANGRFSLG
jgi:hypothetical protein